MTTTLEALSRLVGGSVWGDARHAVSGAAPLADATATDLTLLDHSSRLKDLKASAASAVMVPRAWRLAAENVPQAGDGGEETVVVLDRPAIQVEDVHLAFQQVLRHFRPARELARRGISPRAEIAGSAVLADDVSVGAWTTIGEGVSIGSGCTIHNGVHILAGCRLGAGVTVYPGAVLYEDTVVGDRVIIHAGVVIGAFGFGYKQVAGRHELAAQLGYVELEDDVEVGANSTVDRGTYGRTLVGRGTKIDNQVQVGHNCQIGQHNLLCAQVGIAGSTTTGDYVVLAGQVGVRDHVHIGKGAVVAAMSGVASSVDAGAHLLGIPATPIREQWLKQAAWAKLPEMRKEFKQLQQQVAELERRLQTARSGVERAA